MPTLYSWARLIGLIQADGCFYASVRKDGSLNSAILITIGKKNIELKAAVQNFLVSEGFQHDRKVSKKTMTDLIQREFALKKARGAQRGRPKKG